MDLSIEDWTTISLGDLDSILEKAKKENNLELRAFIENRKAHLKDKELYKKLYGLNETHKVLSFPPEYFNNFQLDPRLKTILQFIEKYNAKTVLDVGCSSGFLLFASKTQNIIDHGVGIEIATSYYDLCVRAKEYFSIIGLSFFNCMFEDFEDDRKFDCVVITEVLEHVMDPVAFLTKAKSFLKDTGHLIISVPIHRYPVSSEELSIIKSEVIQEHVHYFNKEKLLKLTSQIGLMCTDMVTINLGWVTDISVYQKEEK